MLEAMRCLALDFLVRELADGIGPDNQEEWFSNLRRNSSERIFPFLVESGDKIERVYILEPDENDKALVNVDCRDVTNETLSKLPFIQRREKAIGPVVKRSIQGKGEISPKAETQRLTLNYFKELAASSSEWAIYFSEIVNTLSRKKLT
jgi:hypothetical protein